MHLNLDPDMKSESKLTAKDAIIDLVVSHISEEIAIKVPVKNEE